MPPKEPEPGCRRRRTFLFGHPGDHKSAIGQRRHCRRALIVRSELVDQKFTGHRRARGRKNPAIDILHAAGAGLIETRPNDDDVAISQGGDGGILLKIIGEGVDQHIGGGQPGAGGGKKPRINVLIQALHAALPDEGRSTAWQQSHPRVFLIIGPLHIDPERTARSGKRGVQLHRAHAPAITVGDIILPDDKTAIGVHRHVRMNLITRQ